MLSVSKYTPEYIETTRSRIQAQLSAYRDLRAAANGAPAVEAFEPLFFNNMVLVLDNYFAHRGRGLEGKDGNPLNEARVLCKSMLDNDGVMVADKTIRLKPAESLLKYEVGDEIKLSEDDYVLLSEAFFAEIEVRYT